MTPQEIARKRGWQTLADGALVVALVAFALPLVEAVQSSAGWAEWLADWRRWTWAAAQGAVVAGGTAGIAWARRRWVQPADRDEPRRAVDDIDEVDQD